MTLSCAEHNIRLFQISIMTPFSWGLQRENIASQKLDSTLALHCRFPRRICMMRQLTGQSGIFRTSWMQSRVETRP